ncbi:exported hypothetical protein [Desulfamplus magnetovallimortis]|uniref:VCBS repeat-containing protein n=1 Tax=Desulfamplus magnetovallimortis TaxID=1246637 RepID=A0A1W1H5R6_9BACT|nr:VCBS repeat-containing protein [Desulfamplus magnetovallimortis]SLM27708.1 exported hypothetical protein [Desulfamplus magnetovallimortis]
MKICKCYRPKLALVSLLLLIFFVSITAKADAQCYNPSLSGQQTVILSNMNEIINAPVQITDSDNTLPDTTSIRLKIALQCFGAPIDLYVAIYDVKTSFFHFIDAQGNLTLDLFAHKINTTAPVFFDKTYSQLDYGHYQIYWLITPSNGGNFANIDLQGAPFELGCYNYNLGDTIDYNTIDIMKNFNSFSDFTGDGITDLLLYKKNGGKGDFYSTNGFGNMQLMKSYSGWKDWDIIVPGDFTGDGFTDLLFFKREGEWYDFSSSSQGEFYASDGFGNIQLLKSYEGWQDWDIIVPGDFTGNGSKDLLFYKKRGGVADFYSVDESGNMQLFKSYDSWDEWDIIVPGHFNGDTITDLLLFKRYDDLDEVCKGGRGDFYATDGSGNLQLLQSYSQWQDWDLIIPGNFTSDGFTDLLFFKREGSWDDLCYKDNADFYATDGSGNMQLLKSYEGWDEWDLIIPGHFTEDEFTDLLLYKRDGGRGAFYSTDGSGNIELMESYEGWQNWDIIVP